MIAKQIAHRSATQSSFPTLVKYITEGGAERIGAVQITNCEAETLPNVLFEVLATQGLNATAKSDKTYHLMISFPPGEEPSGKVLKEIEESLCNGLGLGAHQRVSAVHHDTDNLHVHVAVNKIHPVTHNMIEPYLAYKKLAVLCEKLEKEHGLQPVNHQSKRSLSQGKAADMEAHSGVISLKSWIEAECLEEIRAATSWNDLGDVLADNGLELRERGNGFVFKSEANDEVFVKASTVARDLSKGKLEKRLGAFNGLEQSHNKNKRRYSKSPFGFKVDTDELFERYEHEQQSSANKHSAEWGAISAAHKKAIAQAKQSHQLRRSFIQLMGDDAANKKVLYAQASKSLKKAIQSINQQYKDERQALFSTSRQQSWADWLKSEASGGDESALLALRSRRKNKIPRGNYLQGVNSAGAGIIRAETVTKEGTVIDGLIKDDGQAVHVRRHADSDVVRDALRLTVARYGHRIKVGGSIEFKAQAVDSVARFNLPVVFDDETLERHKQKILTGEKSRERRNRPEGGRVVGGSTSHARQRTGSRGEGGGFYRDASINKPNVGAVGKKPPPDAKNRLRTLSELGLVRFSDRGELLLPSDVSSELAFDRAQSPDTLRRDVSRERLTADEAAEKYIAEREAKRLNQYDVSKHVRYVKHDGELFFAGIRNVDNHVLALLKNGNMIHVLPVDKSTSQRLQRVQLGDKLVVTPYGTLKKAKGRSR